MSEVVKNGYKKTKLGWIPEDWSLKRFEAVAKVIMGQSPDGNTYNFKGNGVPLINGPTEFTKKYPVKKQWTTKPTKLCKVYDILICVRGSSTGRINISDDNYCVGRGVAAIRSLKDNHQEFIEYQLRNQLPRLLKLTAGSTFPNINSKDINSLSIPTPPLHEQKKIAEILSTWDRAIETLEQLIAQKEELKRGLMLQLLTPNSSEIWNEVELGDLGRFLKGKGIAKSEIQKKGIPAVRYGELYTIHHVIIKEYYSHITRNSAENSTKIQKGDILFACSGETADEIGKCAVIIEASEAYAGGDIVILRSQYVNPVYLSYYLNSSAAIKQKSKLGQGHSVVHIYSRNLKQIKVLLPDRIQQDKIVENFTILENELEVLMKQKTVIELQKKGLMQQLLTGKTRVV